MHFGAFFGMSKNFQQMFMDLFYTVYSKLRSIRMDPRYTPTFGQGNRFTFRERHTHRHDILESLLVIGTDGLVAILGFRFLFALFDANPANAIASLINSATRPFVTPFYSLFSYDHPSVGAVRFEGYTLIAMAVYGLAGAAILRLVSVTRYS